VLHNPQVVAGDAREVTWINYPSSCLSAGGMHPHGEKPNTCLPRDHQPPDLPLPENIKNMKDKTREKIKRTIGLDMHPDVFSAASLIGDHAQDARLQWIKDRIKTQDLEKWAICNLEAEDTIVLEASGNSFKIAERLKQMGFNVLVLESCQAGKIRENYCNDDRSSAQKLARVYLSGLAKVVWQPDSKTAQRRDIFFAYRNSVKDTTRCRNRIRSFLNEHCVRLPQGTRLTDKSGLSKALSMKEWSQTEQSLIEDKFAQLWEGEARRKRFNKIMANEVCNDPILRTLLRVMGIRHIAAFAIGAIIGDINRFENPKKLVGYLGLSPRKEQSGNNKKGFERGLGNNGRRDLRGILIQSAQNALNQKTSALHKWGWKLVIKKHRNLASAAVARKLTVSIWYLLKGFFTPLAEVSDSLKIKLGKIATCIGLSELKNQGFKKRDDFINDIIQKIQLST
jgi:transposase